MAPKFTDILTGDERGSLFEMKGDHYLKPVRNMEK